MIFFIDFFSLNNKTKMLKHTFYSVLANIKRREISRIKLKSENLPPKKVNFRKSLDNCAPKTNTK